MRQLHGPNTRGVSQERLQQLEILKYQKPVKSVDSASECAKNVPSSNRTGLDEVPICLNLDEDVCPICLVMHSISLLLCFASYQYYFRSSLRKRKIFGSFTAHTFSMSLVLTNGFDEMW